MVKYCIFIQGEGGIKYADKTDVAKMGGGPPKFWLTLFVNSLLGSVL